MDVYVNDYSQFNDFFNNMSKLLCTFSTQDLLDETLSTIDKRYSILHNKIFILKSPQSDEYILTYNIDTGNISGNLMPNTILLHRKKENNVLYSINALNILIKSLNNGLLDKNFVINWSDYQNSILLTQGPNFRKLETSIHKIVNFN